MQYISKTTLAAAILLSMQSFNAHSLVVDLDITASSTVTADGVTISQFDSAGVPDIAETELETGNDDPNYAYSHSIGRSNGSFYNRSYGDATFTSGSHVSQLYTVTNDQTTDQIVDFDFEVLWGGISANCGGLYGEDGIEFIEEYDGYSGAPCAGNDFAKAGYNAEITLDGVSIWSSAAQIETDASGTTGSSSGVDLDIGGYTGGTSYYWGAQDFTLDLGSLASGDSFTLEYTIDVFTEGFLANGDYNYAYANFGDPNGFGASGNSFNSNAAAVPEPMTLGLLLSGLFSLGFMSRKRRNS